MRSLSIVFITTLAWLEAAAQVQPTRQGVMSIRLEMGSIMANTLWIKDSTVIYEHKGFFVFDNHETEPYKGYDVYKYTYFDLKTRNAQDYFSFSDTASIIRNYTIQPGDTIGWNYFEGRNRENIDSLKTLPDTIIDNDVLKRILFERTDTVYHFKVEKIYYLGYTGFKTPIIHINKVLENMFGGYAIRRLDVNVLPNKSPQQFTMLRGKLLVEEEKIFKRWQKNAKETTLPILEFQEVNKMPAFPIKLRGNPVYKSFEHNNN